MKIFSKSKKQRTEAQRQRRLDTRRETSKEPKVSRHGFLTFLLYLCFGLLALFICFAGLSSAGPLVQPGQVSRIRITSEIPFSYSSRIETEKRMEAVRQRVPPVFRLELQAYRQFRSYLERLAGDLAAFAAVPENTPEDMARLQTAEVGGFLESYAAGNPFNLRPADLATLYNQLGPERLQEAVSEALIILGEIFRKGVYPEDAALSMGAEQRLTLFCDRFVEGIGDAPAPEVVEAPAPGSLQRRAHFQPVGLDEIEWPQHAVQAGQDTQVLLRPVQIALIELLRLEAQVDVAAERQQRLLGIVGGEGPLPAPVA